MKKKYFSLLVMATLMLGLSMNFVACSDDDDDKNEQRNADADPLDTDEARTAFRWLCTLTDAEALADNWASKTYEPTIGEPSTNDASTRLVIVNNVDEARQNFSAMADVEPSLLSEETTVSQPGVGKLVWTPAKQGAQNLAEVSVDTKLIPHLQKIIYCTHEQTGHNGVFGTNIAGTCYYRLGDVIQDAQGYYWVCVRPSFEPDKGKSHWVNIFNAGEYGKFNDQYVKMPKENIKDKWNKKWAGPTTTILLPTGLKYNREHYYNLSNLIWALINPDDYANTVDGLSKPTATGLCGFEYMYHGKKYLTRVAEYWEEEGIWRKLFGLNQDEMKRLTSMNFFYQGYSWVTGDNATLWKYRSTRYEKNMTGSESKDKEKYDMTKGFDITRYANDVDATYCGPDNYTGKEDGGMGNDGYWVVRYKTGADLDKNYDYFNKIGSCTDIYRYNQKTGKEVKKPIEDEDEIEIDDSKALKKPVVGSIVGSDGNFYKDLDAAKKAKVEAEAVVLYVGNKYVENPYYYDGKDWTRRDELKYNGLAMKLDSYQVCNYTNSMASDMICYLKYSDPEGWEEVRNGLAVMETIKNGKCAKDEKAPNSHRTLHPFINNIPSNWPQKTGDNADKFSQWFVPSVGQWIMALKNFGFTWKPNTTIGRNANSFGTKDGGGTIVKLLHDQLHQQFFGSTWYMTSSEYSETEYIAIMVEDEGTYFTFKSKKSEQNLARRVLFCGFIYDGGATDDSDVGYYAGEE